MTHGQLIAWIVLVAFAFLSGMASGAAIIRGNASQSNRLDRSSKRLGRKIDGAPSVAVENVRQRR